MSNSRALVEHINAINEKTREWVAEDPDNRFACELVTVPDHWADYDVYTPEEFDRYMLEIDYIEGHKEIYGYKYRGDLSQYSDEELQQITDEMYQEVEISFEDAREAELEADVDAADEFATEWDDIQNDFDIGSKVKNIFH